MTNVYFEKLSEFANSRIDLFLQNKVTKEKLVRKISKHKHMRLEKINIKNFKSLGDVTLTPSDLTVIIGPNNSGKTNFSNALRFLSEVYNYGLETAVRRNGGYENIALRKQRRSRASISFEVTIKVNYSEFRYEYFSPDISFFIGARPESGEHLDDIYINHYFSFRATRQSIKAEYIVESERLTIMVNDKNDKKNLSQLFRYDRQENKPLNTMFDSKKIVADSAIHIFDKERYWEKMNVNSQELLISNNLIPHISPINYIIRNWAIYQFNPTISRSEGVPTPNPQIDNYGKNLPALVDWLITNHKEKWETILDTIKIIIPGLTDITTGYLHNKTLGLFFSEEGFGRPWNADEVSDGTILTLSMLCSVIDPRKSMIVLEEPENSIHPWIIRTIMEFLKEVSKEKNIILTTHSPILIDLVHPKDIWTISRANGITELIQLTTLDHTIVSGWEKGNFKISQYIDSGLIPNLVP